MTFITSPGKAAVVMRVLPGKILRKAVDRVILAYLSIRGAQGIETHLVGAEKAALFRLVRDLSRSLSRPVVVVEIGSYLGASAVILAAGVGQRRGRVFCVDTWNNEGMAEGVRDTFAEFSRNIARHARTVLPVRGRSTAPPVVERIARTGGIDLLFIDGDHSYEGVLADWTTYRPMLTTGATIVLHDIGWAEGVQRVVEEDIRPHVKGEGRLPNLWWGRMRPSRSPEVRF